MPEHLRTTLLPMLLAALLGVCVVMLLAPAGPDQEHWDNPLFWSVAYPVLCLCCALLGYFFPRRAWCYGLITVGIQGLPLILLNLDAELVGLGVYLLVAMAVPPAVAGLIGARWARRR